MKIIVKKQACPGTYNSKTCDNQQPRLGFVDYDPLPRYSEDVGVPHQQCEFYRLMMCTPELYYLVYTTEFSHE